MTKGNILLYRIVMGTLWGTCAGLVILYMLVTPKHKITDGEITEIYNKLIAQTGQAQDRLPLKIVEKPIVNAYTDGQAVYIYRGMIDKTKNEEEIALVLGHEIAHNMLRHTSYREFGSSELEVSVAEANADKLGAVYMIKAGYDVCIGRELWKEFKDENGNYQGYDHPTYSYRYDELDINCK